MKPQENPTPSASTPEITEAQVVAWCLAQASERGLSCLHLSVHPRRAGAEGWTPLVTWYAYRNEGAGSGHTIAEAIGDLPKPLDLRKEIAQLEAQLASKRAALSLSDAPTPDPVPLPSSDYPAGSQVNIDRNAEVARELK